MAVKSGRTPTALKNQLEDIGNKCRGWENPDDRYFCQSVSRPYGDYSHLTADDFRLMKKLCRLLLRWVRYIFELVPINGNNSELRNFRKNQCPDTQVCAIEAICHLILEYPALSAAFKMQGAGKDLKIVLPDEQRCGNETRSLLYERTREALICVEEVEVVSLVCSMDVDELRWRDGHDIAVQLANYAG